MKSKEEILIEKPCFEYSTMENRYYEWSDILDAMEEYAQQQVKNLNIPAVVGRSEQLVCPYCKGKNIEIRHREQSFRCIDCKEGWAN